MNAFNKKSFCSTLLKTGILVSVIAGCASLSDSTSRIELTHDALVTVGNEAAMEKKKGEVITLSNSTPVLIESAGKISVLALPATQYITQTKINLKIAEEGYSQSGQRQLEAALSETISQLNEIQVLLSHNRAKEALSLVQLLQQKHPGVNHLKLVEASCLVVLGKKNRAAQILADLKAKYPHDMGILSFYKSLTQNASSDESEREITEEKK